MQVVAAASEADALATLGAYFDALSRALAVPVEGLRKRCLVRFELGAPGDAAGWVWELRAAPDAAGGVTSPGDAGGAARVDRLESEGEPPATRGGGDEGDEAVRVCGWPRCLGRSVRAEGVVHTARAAARESRCERPPLSRTNTSALAHQTSGTNRTLTKDCILILNLKSLKRNQKDSRTKHGM